jgi:ABC-2 type transport system ATP-binding protein
MLHQGKLVMCGALDEIKERHREVTLHFETAREQAPAISGTLILGGKGREWRVMCDGPPEEFPARAAQAGARIVEERAPSLSDIFVAHAGAPARS